MSDPTISLLPKVSMRPDEKHLASVRDMDSDDLLLALGEEFYVGMGAQRLLGHQVIAVFQEWLASEKPSEEPDRALRAGQADLGMRMQACLTVWLDHMHQLAGQRRPRYPERKQDAI